MNSFRTVVTLLFSVAANAGDVCAFVAPSTLPQRPTMNSSTNLNVHLDVDILTTLPTLVIGESNNNMVSNLATAAAKITKNAEMESEVLQRASHFFLDLPSFMTECETTLKCLQVIGRLIVFIQDFLPGSHVTAEEFGFQVAMFAICVWKLREDFAVKEQL